MTIGQTIAAFRKSADLTQDALAQKLSLTNQAVSKWESDQCCPDIALLPKLADIFGISIDQLFGRETPQPDTPWKWANDSTLRVVVFSGHTIVGSAPAEAKTLAFQYEGPALNIHSDISVQCGSVEGDIHCGGSVTCDDVGGDIQAGGSVTCDIVEGNAEAGGNITCDEICGNASAGGNIYCDEINAETRSVHCHRESPAKGIHIHKAEKTEGSTHTITYTISKD